MNYFAFFLLIVMPIAVFAQKPKKIQVVNGVTHKPVGEIYCHILQDNDKWVDIGKTDLNGIFTCGASDMQKNATYQFDIRDDKFLPFRQEIDPFDEEKITVTIYPDTTFTEKKAGLIYSGGSSISFGDYFPKIPFSLNDLPDSIRTKLETHLINRFGTDFYSKLKITDGQILDLDRLYIVEENARNYRWTPYSYYLCFSFSDIPKGIGLFTAKIVLDKYGNVIEEIELPAMKIHPEKAVILSLEQAKAIAAENKFYDEKTDISLAYSKKHGSLIWEFTQSVFNANHTMSGSTLVIDAHSGAILESYGHGGIWD